LTVSSRTPEGEFHHCPVCGVVDALEPSYPAGDSCCPSCGQLLWWFRDNYKRLGFDDPNLMRFDTSFVGGLGADSLDVVEVIMEMEEAFDVTIPEDEAANIRTIADLIRLIRRRRLGS